MNTLILDVREKAKETSFSGVVSIFQSGNELYNEAFGYADIANARKNTVSTRFGIASGTKFFTALGIGVLIDQGRLTLDTRIHDIFQQELTWIDKQATVGHLLTHTSGIFDYYDEEVITDFDNFYVDIPWYRLETPLDYLPLFEGQPVKFLSGERFSYSNGGYICLGMVIEKLTRVSYRDFIQTNIFSPANMLDSGYFAFNQLPEQTANGYVESEDGSYKTNIYNLPIRGASDGGAYTTSLDLLHFWSALINYKILSLSLTRQFLSPQVSISERTKYGYGIYISKIKGSDSFFFAGGDAGVGFVSRYIPESDLQITLFANKTNGEEEIDEVVCQHLERIVL